MASNSLNAINSTSTLNINNGNANNVNICSGGGLVTIGGGMTSTEETNTLGYTTFGAAVDITDLLTVTGGITSTTETNTLGYTTFDAAVDVTDLLTVTGGITSTTATNTLGYTTFGAAVDITDLLTITGGIESTTATNTLGSTTFNTGSTINLNSNKITGLGSPSASSDAATKSYVDLVVQGISPKNPVMVATTSFKVLLTDFIVGSTIDSVVLVLGDRILIKDQIDPIENGLYTVNSTGSPTRTIDLPTGSFASGMTVFVTEGTVNKNLGYICSSETGSDIVGTNSLTFIQFTGAGEIIAGDGIVKSGNELSVATELPHVTLVGELSELTVTGTSTFNDNIDLQNNKIVNLLDPTDPTDAVNKSYADTTYYKSDFKQTVRLASTTAELLSFYTPGASIDSTVLVTGNRILLKDQTDPIENGIYIVNSSGNPTRAPDLNTGSNALGIIVFILAGSTFAAGYFECVSGSIVGTDPLVFTQATANIFAGTGLTKTTNVLSVNASQTQITSVGTLSNLSVSGLVSSANLTINSVNMKPNTDDILHELSFSGAENVAVPTDVTGLAVSYTGTRGFKAVVSITIIATTNLFALYDIMGLQNGSGFQLNKEYIGDDCGVTFSITSTGQIQYISSVYPGFTSLIVKFKLCSLTK